MKNQARHKLTVTDIKNWRGRTRMLIQERQHQFENNRLAVVQLYAYMDGSYIVTAGPYEGVRLYRGKSAETALRAYEEGKKMMMDPIVMT